VRGTASAQVTNTTKIKKKIMAEKKTVSVKVVAKFRDKEDLSVVHEAGEVLEFELDRAHDVVERGLAEYADPIG
jgi:hypothetical protein